MSQSESVTEAALSQWQRRFPLRQPITAVPLFYCSVGKRPDAHRGILGIVVGSHWRSVAYISQLNSSLLKCYSRRPEGFFCSRCGVMVSCAVLCRWF